jgi:hypothetical protein
MRYVWVSAQAAGICCTAAHAAGLGSGALRRAGTTTVLHHPGDAYAYDMFAQIAQALKNPTGIDPMGGLDVQRIVAAGQSQSAQEARRLPRSMQGGSAST